MQPADVALWESLLLMTRGEATSFGVENLVNVYVLRIHVYDTRIDSEGLGKRTSNAPIGRFPRIRKSAVSFVLNLFLLA